MTATLKMAAPGELSSQLKKIIAFCAPGDRSIKAMRQHLGVTESAMQNLINQALEQKLIWRQSNGMYKTMKNKLELAEPEPAQPDQSLLALADNSEVPADATFCVGQKDEVVDIDAELAELEQQGTIQASGELLAITEKGERCVVETELSTLAEMLELDQLPYIENIDVKQRALAGISLLLKTRTPTLASIIDEMSVDLSVVKLHQERRA